MPNYLPEPVENRGGRPSRLTDDLARRIASEVRIGAKPSHAATVCGVARSTCHNWRGRHKRRVQPYASLIGTILLAEGAFIAETEQRLAGTPDWRAAAWILKARRPEVYGNKVEVRAVPKEEPGRIGLTRAELIAEAERRGLPTTIYGD